MEPFKYFSLQSCARLSFVCRGCWGDLKEKGISLRGSGVLPLPGSCREHISRTWLLLQAAPSSSKGQKLPRAPCKSQPNTTRRAPPYDGLPLLPSRATLQPAPSTAPHAAVCFPRFRSVGFSSCAASRKTLMEFHSEGSRYFPPFTTSPGSTSPRSLPQFLPLEK